MAWIVKIIQRFHNHLGSDLRAIYYTYHIILFCRIQITWKANSEQINWVVGWCKMKIFRPNFIHKKFVGCIFAFSDDDE